MSTTIGVLALQGAFLEHLNLLRQASQYVEGTRFEFTEVRNRGQLDRCDAMIIPGGESTTISLVAESSGLLEPLRHFVKVERKPTWGTCAGLIVLAEAANSTRKDGQELIGGLDVRVNRNHFGRQIESFQAELILPFLNDESPFPGVFIRAPIVEKILPHGPGEQQTEGRRGDTVIAPSREAVSDQARSAMSSNVEVMGVLPGRHNKAAQLGADVKAGDDTGDIIAVKQGNVFGTSFHPELTKDTRLHVWWLEQVVQSIKLARSISP